MSTTPRIRATPRPFLKWVGGKGQLLPALLAAFREAGSITRYHEPFVGGGALFFELKRLGMLGRNKSYLSDANTRLIETYEAVRDETDTLVQQLRAHAALHGKEHYYATRAAIPTDRAARAARVIYLNRTCFNGLYRENSRGEFNVPMGRYVNPLICDEENLRAVAAALRDAKLSSRTFHDSAKDVKSGDFVYFDPPYDPLSTTASFTSYHKDDFGRADQKELSETFRELDKRGARVLLSNSDTPYIRKLYKGFRIEQVMASRQVNSRADRRGKIAELLVRNY